MWETWGREKKSNTLKELILVMYYFMGGSITPLLHGDFFKYELHFTICFESKERGLSTSQSFFHIVLHFCL